MDIEKLKNDIKAKFGTMSKFCRSVGYDRYELQKLLQSSSKMKKITGKRMDQLQAITELLNKDAPIDDSYYINEATREEIASKIDSIGGVKVFIEKHPSFKPISVYQITSGIRKTRTKKVIEFLNILNIK